MAIGAGSGFLLFIKNQSFFRVLLISKLSSALWVFTKVCLLKISRTAFILEEYHHQFFYCHDRVMLMLMFYQHSSCHAEISTDLKVLQILVYLTHFDPLF